MPRARSPFAAALADLKVALGALGVDWYLFGAQAALVHGAARVTADVDVTVRLGTVTPARLATALKRNGFSLRVENPSFVRTTRVLPVLHVRTGVPADLVLAGPGLEDAFLERAAIRDVGGVAVPVARAEDLIVMKILAGRDKDLDDVAAILDARGAELDARDVRRTLELVQDALGQSDLIPTWERLRKGLEKPVRGRAMPVTSASRGKRRRVPTARRRTKSR
ncbi:MAG TPA: nucleotidyltransferase [Polyangiaceae bacterium]|nr:nucleotidyltransferase [Polyangiaceae bacterium]